MIYDCFIFFNEAELLKIRLNELSSVVDKFVIVEANQTFSGIKKELNFEKLKKITLPFKEKIIYLTVNLNNSPDIRKTSGYSFTEYIEKNPEAWSREIFQRNYISEGLKEAKPNDIIMISDIDEIPNIKKIKEINNNKLIYGFEQKFFYYYLNCLNKEESWIGTKATYFKNFKTAQELRMSNSYELIKNGGWHFSYFGGIDKIKEKLSSFSHQEFNTKEINNLNRIQFNIENNLDILERPITYTTVRIDKSYPSYIVDNLNKYKSFIKKKYKNSKKEIQLIEEILKNRKDLTKQNNEIENTTAENKIYVEKINELTQEKEKLQQNLNMIQSSKTYKLWQFLNKIKKQILLPYQFLKYFLRSSIFFITFEIKKKHTRKIELKYLPEKFIIDGVSFIIPTWNKEEMVVNCVNNLIEKLDNEYKNIPKEIIVVDNGSIDNTSKSLHSIKSDIPIKVISLKENIGFGPAINLATKKSKYNYVYLLNNDMFPKDNFFIEIINFANDLIKNKKPFFGLSSQIFFYDQTKRREESGKTYIIPKFGFINIAHCVNEANLKYNSITAYPGGGSSLINKYVFKEIGYYDYKSYTPLYCEDLDSGFVTWKIGFPSYYVANSHVVHHHRSSSKSLSISPDFIMHKNWLTFILKNINNKTLYIKHIFSYSILCALDKKYREYANEVFKNKNSILDSKLFLSQIKNKYKEKELINFINFETKNEF